MKNKKSKKILLLLVYIFLGINFMFSIYNIVLWFINNKQNDTQIETIVKETKVDVIEDSEETVIVQEEKEIKKSDPYWDYIKIPLINVNINELKKTNSDIVAWLSVEGTNINYPVVQGTDNTFYLKHSIDKKSNKAGWVFMDYRNNLENDFDKNTLIYAHARKNGSMFGSLKNVIDNNKESVIKLSTEKENTMWQIFSSYIIENTDDYLDTTFDSNEEYLEFLNMLKNRSSKNYETTVNENDKIITLSTCYRTNERVVVHAKLIKSIEK